MDAEIRTIEPEEFERWAGVVETAFGGRPRPSDVERERRVAEVERCLVAVDGAEFVGAAAAFSFEMTVPGGVAPTAAVTAVGVKPTHRRRGINTALMRRILDDAVERGEPVAALFASEGGIYGRFGFGIGAMSCPFRIETRRSAFIDSHAPAGRVRLLERSPALERILPIYDAVRLLRPGMMRLEPRRLEYNLDETHHNLEGRPVFYALHEGGDGDDGYVVYSVKHDWTEDHRNNQVYVHDLQATTPSACADLWRYVLDLDLMDVVATWNRPVDEPLWFLLREPDRLNLRVADGLWVRLVDLPAALERRAYAGTGRLAFEVADAFCPRNDGRYELEASPEGASCRPTDGEPELACGADDLGAVYLGGVGLRQLERAGRVRELRPGALARADALFAWDPAPWSSFMF